MVKVNISKNCELMPELCDIILEYSYFANVHKHYFVCFQSLLLFDFPQM